MIKNLHRTLCVFLSLLIIFIFPISVSALHGDITKDGSVSIEDAVLALQIASGLITPDEEQMNSADIDSDGVITTADARRILRVAAKIDISQEHIFSEWKTTKEPTCTEAGSRTRSCIHCGKTDSEEISPKGHTLVPATCQQPPHCTDCDFTTGEPLEHIDNDGYCLICGQRLTFAVLTYKGNEVSFGCSQATLKAILGEPQNILVDASAEKTYEIYVYYTDYTDLGIFTLCNDKLIQFYTMDTTSCFSTDVSGYSYSLEEDRNNTYSDLYSVGNMYTDKFSLNVYVDTIGDGRPYAFNASVGSYYTYASSSDFSVNCLLNLHITNGLRAINGLKPLEYCDKVAKVAEAHSIDMATNNYFSHTNLDGLSSSQRITNAGISWKACGENIAAGYANAYYAADGWYNSSGHRSNILNTKYEYLGVGIAYNYDSYYGYYSTQNFYAD